MENTKRLQNTTGLKVAFIPATNSKGNRIKITQTNCRKSITISGSLDVEIIEFVCRVLDRIEVIKNYSVCVDNTQSNFYLFNIDFVGKSFENILDNFKK